MGAEYFMTSDGTRSSSSADRMYTSPRAIAQSWLKASRVIPPQFAVGTAYHETSYTVNELDVEPDGHTTGGVFQSDVATVDPLNIGDAAKVGMPELDIFDLDDACMVFAALCERNLKKIFDAVDAWNGARGLPLIDRDVPPPDVWSYLALAHNQGIGSTSSTKGALGTIAHFGLDWADYKRRNAGQPWGAIATDRGHGIYGDDVVTGGPDWRDEYASPFDEAGNPIAAPTVSAGAQSQLRLGLLALLGLLLLYAVVSGARPWKVIA